MSSVVKEKFKNVEFLRFILAVFIVMYHFRDTVSNYNLTHVFKGIEDCSVCVDYFFIIAGFFLFKNFNKNMDTMKFALKKFFRLAPLIWFSLICFLFLDIISKFHFNFDRQILRALLLSNIGFAPHAEATVIHWFVPVLFWTMLFYFYIAKIFDKKYLNLIIWMIVIFSLGGFLNYRGFALGTWAHTNNFYYFINLGVLRGLYGIGIGYFISMLFETDFLKNCSKKLQITCSLLEIGLIVFLLTCMLFIERLPGRSAFLYILMFSILFFLFLRKQGIVSKLLDNNISLILGASSYAIYIMHPVVEEYFRFLFYRYNTAIVESHALIYITIVTTSAIITGFIVHYYVENRINRYIKQKQK